MTRPTSPEPAASRGADPLRRAEAALKRLGYARVPSPAREAPTRPDFWVQEAGVPRRTFPVFVRPTEARPAPVPSEAAVVPARAIVVVEGEGAAEQAWQSLRQSSRDPAPELSVLVMPPPAASDSEPRWHLGTLPPKELLALTTGIVVGMFQRSAAEEGSAQLDFGEMLTLLKTRFGVDVQRSLHVTSDEDALFLLYQLAQRDAYAPGDGAASIHTLVLKPVGPAARLPWFAA